MSIDRRRFLTTTAGVLAAPMVFTAPSFARRARVNEQITVGFIGMGIRSRNLMNGGWLGDDRLRVLAVCDVDTTRRDVGKQRVDDAYENSDCAAYNDYREILARDDIDAVVIATPDHWHAIQAIEACHAGKDVYCEKPLTLTIHEAHACIVAARANDTVFQTGSQQRTEYGGKFRQACELVRNGRIGNVLTVNVGVGDPAVWCELPGEDTEPGLDWDRWLGPAPMRPYHSELSPRGMHGHYPRWRGYREYSGGYFTDMGAHHFDIAQWGLGMDESGPVEAHPPRDETALRGAQLVYDNGAHVVHGGPNGTTFIGDRGMIHVDRGRLVSVPGNLIEDELGEDAERLPEAANHREDFIACVQERRRPICDVEVGARTITCCHLINLCYWNRRALTWDPEAWRFVDDSEANGWRDYERRDGYGLPG